MKFFMNLLSSQNKILFKLIFLQTSLVYSEFPVSKNLNNVTFLPEAPVLTKTQRTTNKTLQQRHSQLKQQIDIASKRDDKNYFACCFVFKLSTGQEIEVPLLTKFIKNEDDYYDMEDNLSDLIISTTPFNENANLTFVSHRPNSSVYNEIQALHDLFLDNVKQDNAAAKNQAMLLKTIATRSVGRGSVINAVSNAMRSTDSEAAAIYILQQRYVIDNIINDFMTLFKDLIKSIKPKPTVTSIEFHGCTTRDMCALCFTNMNIIQYLSYKQQTFGFSFLRYLKYKVQEKTSQALCPTKIFISSFKASNGNLNFNSENLAANYDDDCVYQFRIDEPTNPPSITIVRPRH